MALPFFTIGHSTRSIDEFVDLLSNAEVRLVVDVRTIPRSRTNPQYNSEALAEALSEYRIDYTHIAALGGLRGRKRDVPAGVNAFWQNQRFHNYADYAMSEDFQFGLTRLRELGHATQCANHVRGGGVVAMPSTDHRRLSDRRRRDGIPHSRAQAP
jgi:uncharacterized protein (DUF488 family)